VAEYAGVSVMTVSNVVRGWPYVSDEMRQKVQEAIDTLGYRPSALARSLVTGRSQTIGVVIPDISNPFFSTAIRGCEDVFYSKGYNIFLCNTDEDLTREQSHLDTLIGRGVDALMLWGLRSSKDDLRRIISDSIPVVGIECAEDLANATAILNDDERGTVCATQHLVDAGHRRIAYLAGPLERITAVRRLAGYRRALEKAGLPEDPGLIAECIPSMRWGYEAAMELVGRYRPTAVVCYNDLLAIGAMVACYRLGLRVPEDVALVGYDDIMLASMVVPALSTVRVQQYELGAMASSLLLERLAAHDMPAKTITFPSSLVTRGSSVPGLASAYQMYEMLEKLIASDEVGLPRGAPSPQLARTP
jgi:LacI family transcriptional regulator